MSDENTREPGASRGWDGPYSLPYTLWVLLLTMLVSAFNTLDRTIVSILIERIKADFALTDAQLGLLMGPAFAIVYVFLVLPLARLADVWVRRTIVSLSLLVWSAFTAAASLTQTFAQLFASRMGVGIGEAGGSAPSVSLLVDYLPPRHRARGVSVVSIGATLGMGAGMILGAVVAERFGWRAAFLAAGAPGIALALLFHLTVREPERGASQRRSGERGADDPSPSMREAFAYLLSNPTFRIILLANAASIFAALGRNMWEPGFLIRIYEMSEVEAGFWYFTTSPLPSAFGIWLGGRLADGLGARDARWYLWVPALGQAIAVPMLLAFLLWPREHEWFGIPVALYWSTLGSIVGSFFTAPFIATIQNIAPLRMRALGSGISTMISTVIGLCAGPLFVGVLSDLFVPRFGHEAIRYSLLVPTAMPLVSALVCMLGASRVAGDLERARFARA